MSEQEKYGSSEEEKDEVEAHKKKAMATDDPTASDEDSSDDFEAHKKKL